MFKAVLLVALAIGSCSAELQDMTSENVKDFLSGVVTGLGNGASSTCSTSIATLITVGYKVSQDVKVPNVSLQQDINTLNDMQTLVNSLAPIKICDFKSLNQQVAKIFSKGGWEIILNNYLSNGAAVYADYNTIEKCSANYLACGTAAGNAFKVLVGWALN